MAIAFGIVSGGYDCSQRWKHLRYPHSTGPLSGCSCSRKLRARWPTNSTTALATAPMLLPNCKQCTNSTSLPSSQDASPNLKVISGVVGGMALAMIVVLFAVPFARWSKRKRAGSVRTVGRTVDIESSGSRWGFSASRKPSSRHHHHKEKTDGLYDGLMQPLLPELTKVSAFTWSYTPPTTNSSAESLDELDVADVRSLSTDDATLSHRSTANPDTNSAPYNHRYSVLDGYSGSANHPKRRRSTTQVPPSAKHSTNPPGLPPHTTSSLVGREPYNLLFDQLSPSGFATSPISTVSLSSTGLGAATESFANTPTNKALLLSGVDMQPVSEGHHVNPKLGSGSRPPSLQLPSPPASPPHHSQLPQPSQSRSGSSSHSRSTSQQPADWRFVNAQRPHPTLSSTLSTPTALPFRPPPPRTSTSTSGAWWASPGSQHPGPSSAAPPLTSVFQSRSQASALQRNPSTLTRSPSPIPEASAYDGSSHTRPPSVMSERPTRTPQGARPKPVDMLRQEGSTSSRSARRASMPVSTLSPSSYNLAPGAEERSSRHAYLHSNTSLQTPHIESASHAPEGQSGALPYVDRCPRPEQSSSSLSNAKSPGIEQSPASQQTPPNPQDNTYQSLSIHQYGGSRRNSVSSVVVPGASSSRSRQPAFVRREDSQALKPIPASTLLHSPPHSPPRGSHSRSGSINYPSMRSRSGSTASSYISPPSREGGERDRSGRNPSPRAVLPPVERLPPMEFGSLEGSSGHGSGDK
ncbi:hypothetical protein BDY19DRAFT_905106 [Irpex rosettiformis]|uniref:Uncharacterized protein n=1 Tax=Irpex rosettiformis TaxID=378272 RepID=A0ACB8U965_9APHY|nr:hypothetical protein BDY19DRAFT_905106 [Irpex rosettiformis]